MRRRPFLALLAGAAATTAFAARSRSQEPGRTYRVGILIPTARTAPNWVALLDELRRAGFVEGANLAITGFDIAPAGLDAAAAEMIAQKVDAIVTGGPAPTRAAQQASNTIPILTVLDDFVAQNGVASLARPQGNITGVSVIGPELNGKRQEILTELVPDVRRFAVLADPGSTSSAELDTLRERRGPGVTVSVYSAGRQEEIATAFDAARADGAGALNVLASQLFNANRREIINRAAIARIPAIYQWPEWVEEGGLAAYGPRLASIYRQVARQLVEVLRGAKPGDIPIEQPSAFELTVNLKTAKTLGLPIPAALLARADEVVE